jgi:GAF domain-containing protein/HAMP domain-containing protein
MIKVFNLPENMDNKARNAFWATLVLLVVLVLFDVYATYNLIVSGAIDRLEAALISYGMTIVVFLGIWASRRGRGNLAGWLLIGGALLSLFFSMFTRSGLGILYALVGIIISSAIASLTLSNRQVWSAVIVSILAGAVYIVMDSILPQRGTTTISTKFIYMMFTILVVGELLLVIRQSWGVIAKSLRLKITVWTGATTVILAIILIAYSTITAQQTAIKSAEEEALAFAAAQAQLVRANSELPLDTARALAQALTAAKDPENTYRNLSRSQVNAILKQVLTENSSFLGTYTLWEPNAFDGQDSFYRGKEGHDLTGRFIPYWVRNDDGSINVYPLEDYETAGKGDWYILPRLTKQEVIIAPLVYPIEGVDTVMASFVAPVIYNNKFYGIAGVDAPIAYVQDIVDNTTLYDGKAEAFLITSNGTIIGYRNRPELTNRHITEVIPDYFATSQARVVAGQAFTDISPDGQYLRVFTPVSLGRSGTHWSFALVIPFSEITSAATASAVRQGVIGILLTLMGLVFLWFLSGQIVRPIHALTTTANAVTQGNLNVAADVRAADETGLLANAFNLMITQLRETFGTLEQRVAERTAKMERRNLDLALAAEVGQSVSQVRALNEMLSDAAEIIRAFFGLYYVQVYLANENQTELVLQFGTGEVGADLMQRKHHLPLNSDSINGRAAVTKRSVVISDTANSDIFRPNPLLPNTRSEVAVPLLVGNTLVGVLDVQSEKAGLLNEEALLAFEPMAGQMAVAIQNARLVAETQEARAEVETLVRRLTHAGWEEYLDAIHKPESTGFVFQQNNVTPLTSQETPAEDALVAPIQVTGESLGNLVVELQGTSPISRTDELINTVARQVSQHIESLRLLESAERFRYEAEQASRRLTHEGWQEYKDANAAKDTGYTYNLNEVVPSKQDEIAQMEESGISLPLKVHDEAIGKLIIQGVEAGDSEAIGIANAVAERLSAHIEGLRLAMQTEKALSTTKKQAQREQALRQITSAVRGSTDPTVILRTAARELGSILGRQTVVQLATAVTDSAAPQDNESVSPAESLNADGGEK